MRNLIGNGKEDKRVTVTIDECSRPISLDELIKARAYAVGLCGDTEDITVELYRADMERFKKYPKMDAIRYNLCVSGEAAGADYYEGTITIKSNGDIETEGRYYIFDKKSVNSWLKPEDCKSLSL